MTALFKLVPIWVWVAIAAAAGLFVQHTMLNAAHAEVTSISLERDQFKERASQAEARVESLQSTAKLQRQLTADTEKRVSDYDGELKNANAERDTLAAGLADATYRLRVKAHWVPASRVKPGSDVSATGESDAGTIRLDASAERAYPSLVAGIKTQRAQIIGLQGYVRDLMKYCKIGP